MSAREIVKKPAADQNAEKNGIEEDVPNGTGKTKNISKPIIFAKNWNKPTVCLAFQRKKFRPSLRTPGFDFICRGRTSKI